MADACYTAHYTRVQLASDAQHHTPRALQHVYTLSRPKTHRIIHRRPAAHEQPHVVRAQAQQADDDDGERSASGDMRSKVTRARAKTRNTMVN